MAEEQDKPEYSITVGWAKDEDSGSELLRLHVETEREFTSFGYTIKVDSNLDSANSRLNVGLGGIALPSVGRPQAGPASANVFQTIPADGDIELYVHRKETAATCKVKIKGGKPVSLSDVQ